MRHYKLIFCVLLVLLLAACGQSDSTGQAPESPEPEETVIFDGSSAIATYQGCSEQQAVSGCFYVNLQIENKTENTEEWIYLDDVYVDDVKCSTGTGVPVTIDPGKKANGMFIVFSEASLPDVETVEFKVVVADNENMKTIEESSTIGISPNA